MGDDYVDDGEPTGPSRREVIRRGAILLGVGAWAAPLVHVVRQHGRREGGDGARAPEVIGVQQAFDPTCATCPVEVADFVFCAEGPVGCICVPSPAPYPVAACVCSVAVFCDDAVPCTTADDCPGGQPCLVGGCPSAVCLPPCEEPEPEPLARLGAEEIEARGAGGSEAMQEGGAGKRLTFTGRYV